jgi:predicted nucleic acid-binding protein
VILYLDSSSLVKRYVDEPGSAEVAQATRDAALVGTVMISRVEVAAALAKAVRLQVLTRDQAWASLQAFREDWPDVVRLQVTDLLVFHADALAWEHQLRGFDALQLAAATLWQEMMGERVTFSTFDLRLWAAARNGGLLPHPEDLPELLAAWKAQIST